MLRPFCVDILNFISLVINSWTFGNRPLLACSLMASCNAISSRSKEEKLEREWKERPAK